MTPIIADLIVIVERIREISFFKRVPGAKRKIVKHFGSKILHGKRQGPNRFLGETESLKVGLNGSFFLFVDPEFTSVAIRARVIRVD